MAATVPTRWPVPRPDEGRPSAAAGGSHGFGQARGMPARVDKTARPAVLSTQVARLSGSLGKTKLAEIIATKSTEERD